MTANQHYQVDDADVAAFETDGAVRLRGVVDEDWQDRLRTAIERNLQPEAEYFQYIYVWRRDLDLRDFCFNSPLAGVASQLLPTDKVNLLYDQFFVKEPGMTTPTDWHNDQPYWPVRGPTMSIWLALDEVTEDNGILEFIRGSHRWNRWFEVIGPRLPPRENPAYEKMPDFEAERDRHHILSWCMQPGDVIAFHGLTVHGASGNLRSVRRRGYALRYAAGEVTYHTGPGTLPRFWNRLLAHGQALDSEQYPVVFQA